MDIKTEIKMEIEQVLSESNVEFDDSDIEQAMTNLELSVRENLSQPENKEYFQGAYHWLWNDGASEGDASESDMTNDAARHGVTKDRLIEHYAKHIESEMLNGVWTLNIKTLDWSL